MLPHGGDAVTVRLARLLEQGIRPFGTNIAKYFTLNVEAGCTAHRENGVLGIGRPVR